MSGSRRGYGAVRARRPEPAEHAPAGNGDPCTMIIFGGTGDLARRKLLPAIYRLACEGLLADGFRLVGVAREEHDDAEYREMLREAVAKSDDSGDVRHDVWERLADRIHYVRVDATDAAAYDELRACLETLETDVDPERRNRLFYLAVPPSVFRDISDGLARSRLAPRTRSADERPWARVVVEKPFGHDLESARELNAHVLERFAEWQVFRIDHYLGKETVQNLLVFRFANSIFEPIWNRHHVESVQITAAETVGVEGRARYYEESGVVRDMFQNHLLQLLTLTAMEAPVTVGADAVRDEKVKVLRAIRCPTAESAAQDAVRAQYAAGTVGGERVPGYREEEGVAPDSITPTYAAMRLFVDNWRWEGVPFYLRSGKRLAARVTEIAVHFRRPPRLMFAHVTRERTAPNVLVVRVQPDEGISLRFETKAPGARMALTPEIEVTSVEMDFSYADVFGDAGAPAYQTLLLDVMIGDATLFTRSDEVEAAWRVVDPIIRHWDDERPEALPTYPAGSWGPRCGDELLEADRRDWRVPSPLGGGEW